MIRSMTAFARCEAQHELGLLVCEAKTVNHRYLEMSLRLPDELRAIETQLRDAASAKLNRGKLDCSIRYQASSAGGESVSVNFDLLAALLKSCESIEKQMNNPARMSAIDIMRWPGIVQVPERDLAPLHKAAIRLFKETLDVINAQREAEGGRLKETLVARQDALKQIVSRLRVLAPTALAALRDKLKARIENLGVEAEPGRLEQELAFIAQKLDVSEELDRLDSHLAAMAQALEQDEPMGRRLDFLMQEFNREANTLGSKSAHIESTQASVEAKVLIEQMREQIQNIE